MAINTNETWDRDGNLMASEQVDVPARVITPAELQQAKAVLKTMVQTFYQNGQPTGTPTNAQIRNWLLSLTAAARWLYEELDNEE